MKSVVMSTLSIKLVYVDVNICEMYSDNVKEDKKMRKQEQIRMNSVIEKVWNDAMLEFSNEYDSLEPVRLRSCNARVFETTHYYFLQSYETLVACIDKQQDTLVDVLRDVYGYTSTSAQHISKFNKDYGKGKRGCEGRVTWREV